MATCSKSYVKNSQNLPTGVKIPKSPSPRDLVAFQLTAKGLLQEEVETLKKELAEKEEALVEAQNATLRERAPSPGLDVSACSLNQVDSGPDVSPATSSGDTTYDKLEITDSHPVQDVENMYHAQSAEPQYAPAPVHRRTALPGRRIGPEQPKKQQDPPHPRWPEHCYREAFDLLLRTHDNLRGVQPHMVSSMPDPVNMTPAQWIELGLPYLLSVDRNRRFDPDEPFEPWRKREAGQ